MYLPENKIHIDGKTLEAAWVGPPPNEAPTLILLHEGLGCVDMWRDIPQALTELTGCGVLVYSRLGYGRSDPLPTPWPLSYLHRGGEEELPKVVEALGIQDHIVIGHSDGGSIALIYAGSSKNQGLKAIILEAAHVFHEQMIYDAIQVTRANYVEGQLRAGLAKYHGDNVDNVFWGWCNSWLHDDWWNWNLEGYLPQITVPTLVMQGEDDPYGSLKQVDAIEAGLGGPKEICVLPNCKHVPHREQREKTLERMTAFIRSTLA